MPAVTLRLDPVTSAGEVHYCSRIFIAMRGPSRRVRFRIRRPSTCFLAFATHHVHENSQDSVMSWNPFEDFFEPYRETSRRRFEVQSPDLRSSYGPDGELAREIPCPSCRGRGYVVCPRCDVGTPESSCPECFGKGLKPCSQCQGERTVWVKTLDEITLETSQSCSPLRIEDDEIIDRMEIQLVPERKSKRVYSSPTLEVRAKIRDSLKALDAQTGSITRRMRMIHNDPVLNAKRIAAIKEAKRTEAARKDAAEKMHAYFQKPENRLQRSLSLRGVEFHCSFCGEKGHRRNYCPTLPEEEKKKLTPRSYRCSLCGQLGHKRTKCRSKLDFWVPNTRRKKRNDHACSICKAVGHNARTCQQNIRKGSKHMVR